MTRTLWRACSMGSTDWPVYIVDPDDPDLMLDGQSCYAVTLIETCEILIARTVPRSRIPSLVVHELLHASLGPTISEESVTEAARVIRRTLWTLGYREVMDG
jgi:hypothetical protein